MNITLELYPESVERLPKSGQHIIGCQEESSIVVYQAYNNTIADFAVKNQCLGGNAFSFNRMSWIKPNFLWMMYRCGWAEKENQERVLALWIGKTDFEVILNQAVLSSFDSKYHQNQDQWRQELSMKEVRLQWDPDHDPYGNKLDRRAIQLGLKGKILEKFGKEQIKRVEDITGFVREQKQVLENKQIDKLKIPVETILNLADLMLKKRLGIE